MVCPRCKSQLPAGATSCPKCGARFSQGKRCPYCQSVIPASATACPKCGRPQPQGTAGAASQRAPSQGGKSGGFRWWYILIGVGIFGLGAAVGAIGMKQYIASQVQSAFDQFSSLADSFNPSSAPEDGSEGSSQAEESSAPASGDSGTLGDYQIAILNARRATDYEGKPAIIIAYSFTNNSGENQNFMTSIQAQAFQNGVQLESAVLAGDDETYNAQNIMKDVQPGGTLEVEKAYLLQDEASEVSVEVSEIFSMSKDKLAKSFSLAELP